MIAEKSEDAISIMRKMPLGKETKKRRLDAILIGTIMSIAFAVIIMRFSHYWPCDMISTLKIENIISCSRSPEENIATLYTSIYTSIQQGVGWITNLTR
jgi:hypothetical protein